MGKEAGFSEHADQTRSHAKPNRAGQRAAEELELVWCGSGSPPLEGGEPGGEGLGRKKKNLLFIYSLTILTL